MASYGENDPLLGGSRDVNINSSLKQSDNSEYVCYSQRWLMLAVLSLLSFSNGVIWIMFSPVADITADYYEISADQVNWLSLSFMVISIPMGFVAMWALDTKSLKKLIHCSAWLNLIGAGIRLMSIMNTVGQPAKYPVLLTGQCICATAQPFLLFSTTKLSALWFPEKERTVANAVASMANPFGILVANVVSPIIATSTDEVFWILEASAVPAALGLFFTYMVVTSDKPPTPPSASADQKSMSFSLGLKKVIRNKYYLILCGSAGAGIAMSSVLSTLMEQMLCPRGYSNTFSGVCTALLFGVGILSATLAGYIVDRTRKFEEVLKICYSVTVLFLVAFMLVSRHSDQEILLAFLVACVGFFGFPTFPISLEISVESTYPVSEGTSAGFLQISGQLQSVVCVIALQFLARPFSSEKSVCQTEGPTGVQPQDYTISMTVLCAIAGVAAIILVTCFRCEYRRMQAEGAVLSERLVTVGGGASSYGYTGQTEDSS